MVRKIVAGLGIALAAGGVAVAVPGSAAASPSADSVAAQGTWVYIKPYPPSGERVCKLEANLYYKGHPYQCRKVSDRIELWVEY